MKDLSFDLESEFIHSHTNDFGEGNMHHLFAVRQFLFWVDVINGTVILVSPTLREELEWWDAENGMVTTDSEFDAHCNDVDLLNTKYVKEVQVKVDKIKAK